MHVDGQPRFAQNPTVDSDIRLKHHIQPITNGLDKALQLRAVKYRLKSEGDKGAEHVGFIAQEVEAVIPEVVNENAEGTKSVQYSALTPLLVKAVQDQVRSLIDFRVTGD